MRERAQSDFHWDLAFHVPGSALPFAQRNSLPFPTPGPLSATIASSSDLSTLLAELDADHKYSLNFFLASVSHASWLPTIVLVRDGDNNLAGLLFAKERKLFGMNTGVFFADSTLESAIVCQHSREKEVFETALNALLATKRVRGLRFFISPSGYELEILSRLAAAHNLQFQTSPVEFHFTLQLASSYEDFLERLSYKTRRNFRYFRKRSTDADHVYAENISLDENLAAIRKMEAECNVGGGPEALQRAIDVLRVARTPMKATLKSADGELLSFVCGWQDGNRLVILIQLNSDRRHAKYSLSLVMRSHLIESFIGKGCHQIVWSGGVTSPLSHYCIPIPTTVAALNSQGLLWRMSRKFIASHRHRLPDRLRVQADLAMPPDPPASS